MLECKVCNQQFKKITASHLKKHNLTYDEYLREYEPDKYYNKRAAELLDSLYITVRYKWDILDHKGNYRHCKKGKKRHWGLSLSDIRDHLEGKKTIAVYQPKNKVDFIGLDIDNDDVQVTKEVYEALRSYDIPDKAIIISFSGNKGYHIDVFLSDMLEYREVKKFHKLVRMDTGYSKNQVELAGGNGSHKLPLGLNFKARNSTNEGYCYLCNEYGHEIEKGQVLDKLESIEPMEPEKIKDILEINEVTIITKEDKSEFQDIVDSINLLDSYNNPLEALVNSIEEGITEPGTRHKKAFVLALGYKKQGYCSEEIYNKLIDWHKTLDKEYYSTGLKDCKPEYKQIAKDAFRSRYQLPIRDISKEAFISKEIMEKVLSVQVKGKGINALRKLLFVMIIHSLMYADNKNGIFYMTYNQMNKALNTNNPRKSLKDRIDKLVDQGHIEIIRRNEREEGSKKHKPNKYRVKNIPNKNPKQVFKMCGRQYRCEDCMSKAICFLYTDIEIKDKFNYREFKKITSAELCPAQ